MRNNNFDRTFDVDGMLYDNAKWLSNQVGLTTRDFVDIAEQMHLRQKDWTTFWKMVREIEKRVKGEIEVFICERNVYISNAKFNNLRIALGEPGVESNCCGGSVYPHRDNDHTSRCEECGEGCGIVYVF